MKHVFNLNKINELTFSDKKSYCKIYNNNFFVINKQFNNNIRKITINDNMYYAEFCLKNNKKEGVQLIIYKNMHLVDLKNNSISPMPQTLFSSCIYKDGKPFTGNLLKILQFTIDFKMISVVKYNKGKIITSDAKGNWYSAISIPQGYVFDSKEYIENLQFRLSTLSNNLSQIYNKINKEIPDVAE
jgi:hypothetical protein